MFSVFSPFWFLFFDGFDVVFSYFLWLECCLLFQDLCVLEECQTKRSNGGILADRGFYEFFSSWRRLPGAKEAKFIKKGSFGEPENRKKCQ